MFSQGWQHAGENLEAKVLLIAQAVGTPLDDADLVVESLDETESDLVIWVAVGRDTVPVPLDHVGELRVGLQALPFERVAPVVEEASCPSLAFIAPELTERFLEEISGVEPLVGGEQGRPSDERDAAGLRFPEDTAYGCPRTEAFEGVCVGEPTGAFALGCHRCSMPEITAPSTGPNALPGTLAA